MHTSNLSRMDAVVARDYNALRTSLGSAIPGMPSAGRLLPSQQRHERVRLGHPLVPTLATLDA